MAKSSKEKMRKSRQRKKEGVELPLCLGVGNPCGKQLWGELSLQRGVCSRCWKKTEQGKAETRKRVRLRRASQQASESNNS